MIYQEIVRNTKYMGKAERECKQCSKLFVAPYSLFCSGKCRRLARKTCSNGHELTNKNIYENKGHVYCRLCRKASLKTRDAKTIIKQCVVCNSQFKTKKHGRTVSCSKECFYKLLGIKKMKRNEHSKKIPEYSVWVNIKKRCYNSKSTAYSNYGGRGIKMCSSWFESFDNFYKDMGPRPSSKHEIDRINNDGDYEPTNCRWTTRIVNSSNKRFKPGSTGIVGIRKIVKNNVFSGKYKATIRRNKKNFKIGIFDSIDKAIAARNELIKKYEHLAFTGRI